MDDLKKEERLVYTAEEVAKLLQTNRAKVYELINKGLLRTTKIGRRKITKEALTAFLSLVDGVDVDAVMARIPDGRTLDDLACKGLFGEKAKKNSSNNADLKRYLTKGPQPKEDDQPAPVVANGNKDIAASYPFVPLSARMEHSSILSDAEKRRIARRKQI